MPEYQVPMPLLQAAMDELHKTQDALTAATRPTVTTSGNLKVAGDVVYATDVPGVSHVEAAELVDAADYGPEGHPDAYLPRCQWPGCKTEAKHQLFVSAHRELSINSKGEIVRGKRIPRYEEPIATVGPLALQARVAAAQLQPKPYLDLCQRHFRWDIPFAPLAPRKIFTTGPYTAWGAERRAQKVERITGEKVTVITRKVNGVSQSFVNGDDPSVPGWSGRMTPEPQED